MFYYCITWKPRYSNTLVQNDTFIKLAMMTRPKQVSRKSYNACGPLHVRGVNRFFLEVHRNWFSQYEGDEIGKIYDYHIAEFSEDNIQLRSI